MGSTFLVTGVSSGLGRAIALAGLDAGHTVVGTVRRESDAEAFSATAPGRAHARLLDVTDADAVLSTVTEVERTVGPVDVLVANAGYGHEGLLEETSMAELRRQFEVNVFGAVAVIKAVLPGMRARRSGHILGVTSMGGLRTFPGLAAYHGSKYALEGILDALAREVAGFGVRVTAIEPGSFRTDWAGRSMVRSERTVPDYDTLIEPRREARRSGSGRQLGDPAKAAAAVLQVVGSANPPVHLLLGSDAVELVGQARAEMSAEFAEWEALARSTDFPDGHRIR
ncbi:oxidoreductase [Pseudonocardia sp. NPDC046786]|uniref:oxidoreductase n=1 Tax=Pseudonocardia sp. NPDC046786 TaxID=3155471 RepID=UPI0033F1D9D1